MRLIAVLVTLLAFPATAAAQSVDEAAQALRSDPVFVAPDAELAGQVDAPVLRGEIGEDAVFIAVLPESAVEGSPGRTLIALREAVGEKGRYALVTGDDLRTLPAEPGEEARAAHPDDLQAALSQFIDEAESSGSGSGGAIAAVIVGVLLVGVVIAGSVLLVSRRRARAKDGRSEVGQIDQTSDFVRLGDQIRALELDITLGEAGRADYERALAAYDRANELQRKGDETGANHALDEGLAAIAAARNRIAGR